MSEQQNATKIAKSPLEDAEIVIAANQQQWIDFNAVGGMLTDSDGLISRMTITDFAERLGVNKATLYRWKDSIPDFWDRVKQRRKELGGQARLNKVYNGLYLKAAAGNPDAIKLWLQIFDDWRPPSQSHEVGISTGLADLIAEKRKTQVIDATPIDPTNSPSANA